jgi:purine-binding chemotaxis protein CheW
MFQHSLAKEVAMNELAVVNITNTEEKRHLIFNINKELYGINVTYVNNIIQMPSITRVPNAPACYSGIINLRGELVPVMSMRRRLGTGDDTNTKDSRIVILNLEGGKLLGIIVDEVKEVVTIDNDEIEAPSPFISGEASLISGIGKKNDDLISLLEIDSILEQKKAS